MISRRQFVQAITGTLAALGLARTGEAEPDFTHQFYPPLDGPITGWIESHGRVFIFTERSVYDGGPV